MWGGALGAWSIVSGAEMCVSVGLPMSIYARKIISVLGALMDYFIRYSTVLRVLVCSGGCELVWVVAFRFVVSMYCPLSTHTNCCHVLSTVHLHELLPCTVHLHELLPCTVHPHELLSCTVHCPPTRTVAMYCPPTRTVAMYCPPTRTVAMYCPPTRTHTHRNTLKTGAKLST